MSFASDVKDELIRCDSKECCKKSELSTMLKMAGDIVLSSGGVKLEFRTTNPAIARRMVTLVKQLYKAEVQLMSKRWMKLNKQNIYYVTIVSQVMEIMSDLRMRDEFGLNRRVHRDLIKRDCCKRAALRGAFLVSGSVNSPLNSSYHLEIASSEDIIYDIDDLMNFFNLHSKVTDRRKGHIAYIKKVEKISDFLRLVDAMSISMVYEDIRINRDFTYQIRRYDNIDVANAEKTIQASGEQFDNIALLKEVYGDKLPPRIKEVIELREAHPEGSMQELSDHSIEVLGRHITKSGINHRFRDIKKMCEEIKEKREE